MFERDFSVRTAPTQKLVRLARRNRQGLTAHGRLSVLRLLSPKIDLRALGVGQDKFLDLNTPRGGVYSRNDRVSSLTMSHFFFVTGITENTEKKNKVFSVFPVSSVPNLILPK